MAIRTPDDLQELRIHHNYMERDGAVQRPVATRHGQNQTVDEVWVGSPKNWNLLGVTSVTKKITKDFPTDKAYVTYVYMLNGTPIIERTFRVNFDDSLGDLLRERSATIGELK